MLIASSVRPAPISPARPTISPRRTVKLSFLQTKRSGTWGWRTVQFFTSKNTSPMCGVRSGKRLWRLRPTMPRMMRSSSTSCFCTSSVSMVLPSRRMVIESAICSISLSLWLMMIELTPLPLRPTIRSSRCCESLSLRAAVGSSRISSFTDLCSAFAISTSCCLPTPMCLICVSGSSRRPTRCSTSAACFLASRQLMTPARLSSLPRKMFSVMVSSGMSASSWWMIAIPAASLWRMSRNLTTSPW